MNHKKYLVAFMAALGLFVAMPAFADVPTPIVSYDGKHSATMLIKEDGSKRVVYDGKELTFNNIDESQTYYFDSANRLIFVVKQNGKSAYVINGTQEDLWCSELGPISSTVGGSVASYVCGNDSKYSIRFLGGYFADPFSTDPFVSYPYASYSNDSKLFWYTVCITDTKCYFLLSDGRKVGMEYDTVGAFLLYGKNNDKLFYSFTKNGKQYVMADGKLSRAYDEIANMVVSPDNTKFHYRAKKGNSYFMITNNRIVKWPLIDTGWYLYSTTKKIPHFSYQTAAGWMVSVAGMEYGPYDQSPWTNFNDDDSIWAAFVTKGGKSGVLVNGKYITP